MVPSPVPTGHLAVAIGDLQKELRLINALGSSFWYDGYYNPIQDLISQLDGIGRASPDTQNPISISTNTPLKTRFSCVYDGDRKVSGAIRAEISGTWDLTATAKKRQHAKREVWFSGTASTRACFIDEDGTLLARWTMEFGTVASPGSFFHTQVKLGDEPPFDKDLSVPRWPFHVATPASAIEFVLGELFQHEWEAATSTMDDAQLSWNSLQKQYFEYLRTMQASALKKPVGSPLMLLKKAKPGLGVKLLG